MHALEAQTRSRPRATPSSRNEGIVGPSTTIQGRPTARILWMQQTLGNQAVQQFLRSGLIQPKLRVGAPGDVYEQEADRVAEQVIGMPASMLNPGTSPSPHNRGARVQRVCAKCEEEMQREASVAEQQSASTAQLPHEPAEVTSALETKILGQRGGGARLPGSVRDFFEPRFGRDFSQVRVHADSDAAQSAREVEARAYTVGNDIFFGSGEFAPENSDGQRLLAHELTHVIQQVPTAALARPESADSLSVSGRIDAGPYVARYPPCPKATTPSGCYGRCGTGGVCSWTYGSCKCLGSATKDSLPAWLVVLLSAAALALIAACFASGVCELAAIVAAVGVGLAAVVVGILRASGVIVDGGSTTASIDDSGQGQDETASTASAAQDQSEVASQYENGSVTSNTVAESEQEEGAYA